MSTGIFQPSSLSPLTTKGDIWVFGTGDSRLPVGSNGQVLLADSTQALGVKWGPAPASTAALVTNTTKVAGFTAVGNNYYPIDGSGGTFLITLDAASGYSGQLISFTRVDSSLDKPVSIKTSGSTTVHIVTVSENWSLLSDGASWKTQSHYAQTNWATFSMNVISVGSGAVNPVKSTTLSIDSAIWRRVGDSIEVKYTYRQLGTNGSSSGVGVYEYPVPTGVSLNTNLLSPIGTSLAVNNFSYGSIVGTGTGRSVADTSVVHIEVMVYDAIGFVLGSFSTGQFFGASTVSSTYKYTSGNDLSYSFHVPACPVLNWEG